MPDAIDLLKRDHEKVRGLLKRLTDGKGAAEKRAELLTQIQNELELHTLIEEEIFYPAFRDADAEANGELFHESMEEHRIIDEMVVPDLELAEVESDEFAGRAKVLRELVEHHIEDEEEEMFPKAREMLGDKALEELGKRMEARKLELLQEA